MLDSLYSGSVAVIERIPDVTRQARQIALGHALEVINIDLRTAINTSHSLVHTCWGNHERNNMVLSRGCFSSRVEYSPIVGSIILSLRERQLFRSHLLSLRFPTKYLFEMQLSDSKKVRESGRGEKFPRSYQP